MRMWLPLCVALATLSQSVSVRCQSDAYCADSCCANSTSPQSCRSCAVPGNCRDPLLQPTSFSPYETPYYEHVMTRNYLSRRIDNVCITFFNLTATIFLGFRSIVWEDGSVFIEKYIFASVRDCQGVYRLQGSSAFAVTNKDCYSCVITDYVLGEACPGTYVLYRCFFEGDCDAFDRDAEIRVGLSTYRDLSDCCKDRIIALANQQRDVFYLSRKFFKFRGRLNRKCVAYYNGVPCINSAKIKSQDAISLPEDQFIES